MTKRISEKQLAILARLNREPIPSEKYYAASAAFGTALPPLVRLGYVLINAGPLMISEQGTAVLGLYALMTINAALGKYSSIRDL